MFLSFFCPSKMGLLWDNKNWLGSRVGGHTSSPKLCYPGVVDNIGAPLRSPRIYIMPFSCTPPQIWGIFDKQDLHLFAGGGLLSGHWNHFAWRRRGGLGYPCSPGPDLSQWQTRVRVIPLPSSPALVCGSRTPAFHQRVEAKLSSVTWDLALP